VSFFAFIPGLEMIYDKMRKGEMIMVATGLSKLQKRILRMAYRSLGPEISVKEIMVRMYQIKFKVLTWPSYDWGKLATDDDVIREPYRHFRLASEEDRKRYYEKAPVVSRSVKALIREGYLKKVKHERTGLRYGSMYAKRTGHYYLLELTPKGEATVNALSEADTQVWPKKKGGRKSEQKLDGRGVRARKKPTRGKAPRTNAAIDREARPASLLEMDNEIPGII
jgi:hypothetical protein